MKSLTKILLGALLGILSIPLLASAAATIDVTATTVNPLGVKVEFSLTGHPSQKTKIYASVAKVENGSWIKRDIYLLEVVPTDPSPVEFDVIFNKTDLGLQEGKTYVYYLADKGSEPLNYLTNPKCFNLGGEVPCSTPSTPTPSNGDDIYYGQTTTPTAPASSTTPATPTVPATTTIPSTTTPTVPSNPTGTYQAPPQTFGGISVTFPRESQIINETSAEIHGIVSALIIVPVELSFVSGIAGKPLGNAQSLLSTTLMPGQNKPITMKFTGLNAGTSYYFVLKNKKTNAQSYAIYFTTPGGTTNERAMFAGKTLGGQDAPPDVVFEDKVSDKGIVPKCGRSAGPNVPVEETRMCGFKDFMQLVANIINFALVIIGPIIAVFLMYTGVMIIIYGKKSDPTEEVMKKLKKYKEQFFRIGLGIIIIIFAWTIIATILRELGVKPNYIMLDLFSGN